MADVSDVEETLKTLISSTIYPNGTSQPSITNAPVIVYRGWPVVGTLEVDLPAGKSHVSIYSQRGVETNTTRYRREDVVATAPVHTLTAAVAGDQVTIGGTVATPQNVIVLCGPAAFSYAVQAGDNLPGIASALAQMIGETFPGTSSSGPVITIAGSPGIVRTRIAGVGTVFTEQRRQLRGFQITCWCGTPPLRDALASAIDLALAAIDFLTMPDGGAARLRYESSVETDQAEKAQIFRRDLFYSVEYATATITQAPEIGAISVGLQGGVSPATAPVDNFNV